MRKILKEEFFSRPAPLVAKDLIGKYLIRSIDGNVIASMITEAEAYEGHDDLASHASKGKTPRTEVMFGKAGRFYVYLIYGMYFMLNVVTGEEEYPSAVLIRSTEIARGPGRLTRFFFINKRFNALSASRKTGLWFEDRGIRIPKKEIAATKRVGVDYAGPIWSVKPWRFVHKKDTKRPAK
jgi:DNA-3-methyladenine glycosylase